MRPLPASCNSAYRLRYWNVTITTNFLIIDSFRCNSAYRLRYWNRIYLKILIKIYICCNSAYRLRYWNFAGERPSFKCFMSCNSAYRLRYWNRSFLIHFKVVLVATVLTACGIETWSQTASYRWKYPVATVLTACGIETMVFFLLFRSSSMVATVLTACGIETEAIKNEGREVATSCNSAYRLRYWNILMRFPCSSAGEKLQQCLPLAVLKRLWFVPQFNLLFVATVLTACGIETINIVRRQVPAHSCNSAYRLRYWNKLGEFELVRNWR